MIESPVAVDPEASLPVLFCFAVSTPVLLSCDFNDRSSAARLTLNMPASLAVDFLAHFFRQPLPYDSIVEILDLLVVVGSEALDNYDVSIIEGLMKQRIQLSN